MNQGKERGDIQGLTLEFTLRHSPMSIPWPKNLCGHAFLQCVNISLAQPGSGWLAFVRCLAPPTGSDRTFAGG